MSYCDGRDPYKALNRFCDLLNKREREEYERANAILIRRGVCPDREDLDRQVFRQLTGLYNPLDDLRYMR